MSPTENLEPEETRILGGRNSTAPPSPFFALSFASCKFIKIVSYTVSWFLENFSKIKLNQGTIIIPQEVALLIIFPTVLSAF